MARFYSIPCPITTPAVINRSLPIRRLWFVSATATAYAVVETENHGTVYLLPATGPVELQEVATVKTVIAVGAAGFLSFELE